MAEWNDWRWHLRHRICTLKELERFITLSPDERRAFTESSKKLPVAITPYYVSLIDPDNSQQAIRRTMVPVHNEHVVSPGEAADPLGEDSHSPVPSIVHRYPDRVLFLCTTFCGSYCRYCTRSRMIGNYGKILYNREIWERAIQYIEATPSIRDVLLSGGDPLTLPDEQLEWLLTRLRKIPHVEIIRIGTKAPVVLPQRITPMLVKMLRQYHPLFMSIHFTHPDEITPECAEACTRLSDAGIPLGSQTVLLSGINDNPETMRQLMHGLLKVRVRPYYIYQCDPIHGSAHFRTPVQKGLDVIQGMRGHTTGYAVPTFVIDAPGGGGKIPLQPNYVVKSKSGELWLKNYEGEHYRYPDYL
ncbi:MAG: KamA family radical SAM protein [Fibrobacterota bacterium]